MLYNRIQIKKGGTMFTLPELPYAYNALLAFFRRSTTGNR